MALSATGEGCHKEMGAILDDLVNGILVFLKDSVEIIEILSFKTLFLNYILASTCSLCSL
jgi:hypothetical protein